MPADRDSAPCQSVVERAGRVQRGIVQRNRGVMIGASGGDGALEQKLAAKSKPDAELAAEIRNHVREGAELATENGLPGGVRSFIMEHHGTAP